MILAHEQDVTERYSFSLKFQMVHAKMNLYFNLLIYSLNLYIEIHMPHTHISTRKCI